MPTLTYNFDPEQTVFTIIDCDAKAKNIQRFPATGNIIVKEGVVKEVKVSISENRGNADARMAVQVLGGAVTAVGTAAQLTVDVVGGVVTAVALVNGGSGYINGTAFTFLLTTTAGGGDGFAEITYDVVSGSIANPTVSVAGTTYTNGLAQAVTDVPSPTGVRLNFGGKGYFPDTAQATFTVDVVSGVVSDVAVVDGGAQYTDGTNLLFTLLATAGGGDGAAVIKYDVVDGVITNPSISVGGTTYGDGFGQAVDATDIPVSQNSFFLLVTSTGGDGLAQIGYNVVSGAVVNAEVLAGGSGYSNNTLVGVNNLDIPPANENDHELLYNIRFSNNLQAFDIEAPVDAAGVEQTSDIFDNLTAAVDEYELRIA